MIKKILCILYGVFISYSAMACSVVFISGKKLSHATAVARTMDFPYKLNTHFAFGRVGAHNTSNLNLTLSTTAHPLSWITRYAFVGTSLFGVKSLVDGINNQGLNASFTYLPGETRYPVYHKKNSKPTLAIGDILNFLLGTAANVPEALNQLKKCQLVISGLKTKYDVYITFPVHVMLNDREGNTAIIEWIGGQMHIYSYHPSRERVIETMTDARNPIIFDHIQAAVLTNSPSYSWQLKHAKKYNFTYNGTSDKKYNGLYMHGSGMDKLPGDFTPPSRFVRAYQLVRAMPKVTSETQALLEANQVIDSVMVPISANPSPTFWLSLSDLKNNRYYFKNIISLHSRSPNQHVYTAINPTTNHWKSINLNTLDPHRTPSGMIDAVIHPQDKASALNANSLILSWIEAMTGSVKPLSMTTKLVD